MNYEAGTTVFTNWTIAREIGTGASGKDYEIHREAAGMKVKAALKVIRLPGTEAELFALRSKVPDEEAQRAYLKNLADETVKRFFVMSGLKSHPHIVSYEDYQVIPREDMPGYDILIRTELVRSLVDYHWEHPLKEEDVLRLGREIGSALDFCERKGIFYREINPGSLFVGEEGQFKLGDFGIADAVEAAFPGPAKAGAGNYMAPEVYMGNAAGPGADTYSLGLVLYYFLNNGRLPFYPPSPAPITLEAQKQAKDRRMSGENIPALIGVSRALSQAVLKMCAYRVPDRYQTAEEMTRDLESLGAVRGAQTKQRAQKSAERTGQQEAQKSIGEEPGEYSKYPKMAASQSGNPRPVKRKKKGALIAGIIIAAVVVLGGGAAAAFFLLTDTGKDVAQTVKEKKEEILGGDEQLPEWTEPLKEYLDEEEEQLLSWVLEASESFEQAEIRQYVDESTYEQRNGDSDSWKTTTVIDTDRQVIMEYIETVDDATYYTKEKGAYYQYHETYGVINARGDYDEYVEKILLDKTAPDYLKYSEDTVTVRLPFDEDDNLDYIEDLRIEKIEEEDGEIQIDIIVEGKSKGADPDEMLESFDLEEEDLALADNGEEVFETYMEAFAGPDNWEQTYSYRITEEHEIVEMSVEYESDYTEEEFEIQQEWMDVQMFIEACKNYKSTGNSDSEAKEKAAQYMEDMRQYYMEYGEDTVNTTDIYTYATGEDCREISKLPTEFKEVTYTEYEKDLNETLYK